MLRFLFTLAFSCCALAVFSQDGIIRGKIIDDETGEELIGATVQILSTGDGVVTDFEGNYSLTGIPAGKYDLVASFVSFQRKTISGVTVKAGEVTITDIRLAPDNKQLNEVVVTAEVIKDSEVALLTVKRKSVNLLDGISAQSIRAIGDSHVASALKRVSGVSIQGGKYVYVRGLGDRYTKSILNGMDIPGLDPDRNTLQMDLFPTSIIDNVVIFKAFSADLPADFTGGVVNIETKDFPEKKTLKVSASAGYTPGMHFNKNFLTYEGSSTDFLGFDDGSRDLPISRETEIPLTAERDPRISKLTRKFNPVLAPQRESSLMNFGFGLSAGNQVSTSFGTIGYTLAGSYKSNTDYYSNVEYGTYLKPDELDRVELRPDKIQTGEFGTQNVLLSSLAGLALKTGKSKYRLVLLHLQNGESKAGVFNQSSFISSSNSLVKSSLLYSERSLSNLLLSGKHVNDDASWEVEWKLSPTLSKIADKDFRVTPFKVEDGVYSIDHSEAGAPLRIWRNLEEVNYAGKADAQKEYLLRGLSSKLKFGIAYTYKQRNFGIDNYRIGVKGNPSFSGDPDELLLPDNIYTVDRDYGTFLAGNYEISNTYEGRQTNFAGYVSNDFSITEKLKSIIGVRAEKYVQRYTGMDQQFSAGDEVNGRSYENEKVLDLIDLFPSVNFIYNLSKTTNLRAIYYKTTARPSFKEASIAQIFDPISGRTFIGGLITDPVFNPDPIKESLIHNFDVRWETFQSLGQTLSISAFYKGFIDPIELVTFSEAAPDNFQPRNMGDARVYGLEFEARKNLSFLAPAFETLSFNTNVSFIRSELQMDKEEYESRLANARTGEIGEEVSGTRPMQGQAPYLINAGLSYEGRNNGFEAGAYYNVQGEKLAIVGIAGAPDVYDQPFHSLNLTLNKKFGEAKKINVGMKAENLLGDLNEQMYESAGSESKIFSRLNPGRTFSVNFGYSF